MGTGGLVEDGTFAKESITGGVNVFGGAYEYDRAELSYSDEAPVYINYFLRHWGNFIIDVFSRLWVLENLEVNIT